MVDLASAEDIEKMKALLTASSDRFGDAAFINVSGYELRRLLNLIDILVAEPRSATV